VPTFIALLRAVNVGGRVYKMADLRAHLEAAGLTEVESYIQTGNVRFRTSLRSVAKVEAHLERTFVENIGFEVPTILLTPEELTAAYTDARGIEPPAFAAEGQRRYVTFFKPADVPSGQDAKAIEAWDQPGESALVLGRAVHLWLAHPTHEARFHGAFRKALAPGTARDLRVVTTLAERWGA
jgi:uncharacterized protein (DUF1697 family)